MRMKYVLLRIIALIVMVASSALADASSQFRNSWQWEFVSATPDYQSGSRAIMGVGQMATDGWDGESLIETATGPTVYVASFHTEDSFTWSGQTGFYEVDFHAPLMPGQTKVWRLYVWATPDVPATSDMIEMVITNPMMAFPSEEYGLQFRLTLKSKPSSVTGGPDIGTVWSLDYGWGDGFLLPIYRTDNGLNGYLFEFSATAVPEPSSLLALAGGMGCLAALLKRRRS